ncbi:MAG TPA: GDSL-type esterase/lipase family protein, partial [Segetibacter sp.]|nr:GDSL-type esterase/lipase family protein [Segetibacter sp.]
MHKNIYHSFLVILILVQQSSLAQSIAPGIKRILFLGNSITWAGNYVNDVEAYLRVQYPGRQLEFINVGLSSETVSGLSEPGHAGGSFPRPDLHERLARVLKQTKPDLVFACYGMNDGIYMPFDNERFQKFKDGINWLHDEVVKTGARLIHLTPPYYDEVRGKSVGYAAVLDRYSDWLISMGPSLKWEVIDIHYPMKKYLQAHRDIDVKFGLDGFALAQDGVHPGEVGHWIVARQILLYLGFKDVAYSPGIAESLQQIPNATQYVKLVTERQNMMRDAWLTATKHKRPGLPVGLPLTEAQSKSDELLLKINSLIIADTSILKPAANSAKSSKWMGFNRTDFVLQGRNCLVVEPTTAAPGKPWIWRTEFFGHEPQGDSTLAAKGFHVVYIDLQDMYGAPVALDLMDKFYEYLVQEKDLNKKTVLEGFSRGGLFAFNWAARNPGKVSGIYVDAPVCDFKSWPGGKGKGVGSPSDWGKLKKVYDFASDQEAMEYKGNPIDNLEPLAQAKIPILCVCGETDEVVPMAENISIVEERYKKLGGEIKIIAKPNNGHHPHSLKDPTPIV